MLLEHVLQTELQLPHGSGRGDGTEVTWEIEAISMGNNFSKTLRNVDGCQPLALQGARSSAFVIASSANGAITAYPASFGNRPSFVHSRLKARPSANAE